VDEGKGGLDPC